MGLFDSLSNALGNAARTAANGAAQNAVGAAKRGVSRTLNDAVTTAGNKASQALQTKTKSFTFATIPTSVDELKALPGLDMKDYFCVAAVSVLVLCNYTKNKQATIEMYDFLMGPGSMSGIDTGRIDDSLIREAREYLPFSYFEGATVANGYTPNQPYKITIIEGPHSKDTFAEGYVRLFVMSAGADNERTLVLRTKPSTGEWFLTDLAGILPSIRIPAAANPWA